MELVDRGPTTCVEANMDTDSRRCGLSIDRRFKAEKNGGYAVIGRFI